MKIKNAISFALITCLFWQGFIVCAQAQSYADLLQPEISNFTKEHYRGHHQNWALCQNPRSKFIYMANSNGLLEYDGNNWELYKLPFKQVLRSVACSEDGKIFTGALGAFGYWAPNRLGALQYHSLIEKTGDTSLKKEEIWHILCTKSGVFFQSFAFIYFYDFKRERFTKLQNPGTMLFVHEVFGRYFVGLIGNGLYEIRGKDFIKVNGSDFLGKENIVTILPLDVFQKSMLIGTAKHIYKYADGQFKVLNSSLDTFLQTNQLNKGIRLAEDVYALGTIQNGLLLVNKSGDLTMHLNQQKGLNNNTVLALAQDEQQNLWLGLDKGLSTIKLGQNFRVFPDLEGKLGTVYDALLHKDILYVGTNQGLYAYQKKGKFELLAKSQGQVWDVARFGDQIFCGHNNGTFLVDGFQLKQISDITGGWVLRQLNETTLIQGTYTRLCIYKKNRNDTWSFSHAIEGFSDPVKQMEYDGKQSIWVNVPTQGIKKIRLNTAFTKVLGIQDVANTQTHELFENLQKIDNKILLTSAANTYAATEINGKLLVEKLSKYQAKKLFQFSGSILAIEPSGALSVQYKNKKPLIYPIKQEAWVENFENIVDLDTQHYLICGENGLIFIPKSPNQKTGRVDSPIVKSIGVLGADNFERIFREPTPVAEVELDATQNNIQIKFASRNYQNDIKYSYMLENLSNSWTDYQSKNTVDYNGLSAGDYVFKLKNNLSDEVKIVNIKVRAPWYWNVWSKIFYMLLLFTLAQKAYKLQLQKIHKQQSALKEKLEQQLQTEKEQSERQLITLRNEQLEKDIIAKSKELANSTMNLVKKNELLAQLKQELLAQHDQSQHTLSPKGYKNVMHLVESNLSTKHDWQVFEENFNSVHEAFLQKLIEGYPMLSASDLKLAAYLRMNLNTKEIAHLLNITPRGVELKRYRLRKKMQLKSDINLSEYLIKFKV